jgi:hypothetical protein
MTKNERYAKKILELNTNTKTCFRKSIEKILQVTIKNILSADLPIVDKLDDSTRIDIANKATKGIVEFFIPAISEKEETYEEKTPIREFADKILALKIIDVTQIDSFNDIVTVIDSVYSKIKETLGFQLFIMQIASGFFTAFNDRDHFLFKSVNAKNVVDILRALLRVFISNLPTTCHKIFQMVDPLIKKNDKIKDIYVWWLGDKLKYPKMGKIEIDVIQNNIIKKEHAAKIRVVEKTLAVASVGQVHILRDTISKVTASDLLKKAKRW